MPLASVTPSRPYFINSNDSVSALIKWHASGPVRYEELRQRCEDLLAADEHHDWVIREACVILEDSVRKAIGAGKDVVGVSLMQKAFSPNNNLLRLSEHDKEQLGAMNIYSGVMACFRNAAGHNLIDTYSQEDALRFVVFVDLLLAMVAKTPSQQDTGEV